MICKITVKKKSDIQTAEKRQLMEIQEATGATSTNSLSGIRQCRSSSRNHLPRQNNPGCRTSISYPTTNRVRRRSTRLAVLRSVSTSKLATFSGSSKSLFRKGKCCFRNRRRLIVLDGQLFKKVSNTGGGDCFFKAIVQGLRAKGLSLVDHEKLRELVGCWIEVNDFNLKERLGIIPAEFAQFLNGPCPSRKGWKRYAKDWTWRDWGQYIKKPGQWAGGLEVQAVNAVLEKTLGSNLRVQLFAPKVGFTVGANEDKTVGENIVLIIHNRNHYQWLKPACCQTVKKGKL